MPLGASASCLPLVRNLEGNTSFLSDQKLRQTAGWEHKTSWCQYLGAEDEA
jgi:hypothetical protein